MKLVKRGFKLGTLSLAIATVMSGMALSTAAQAEVTGNIGVVSKYVFRGLTNDTESDTATLQGGLDWSHSSGVYVGYWGSGLDYANKGSAVTGFENDIYAGYKLKAGPVDLNFGATRYVYNQVQDSDATEAMASAGMVGVTLTARYLLDDVAWGNKGDIYWSVDYSLDLPNEFTLSGLAGYYTYEDSGEFIASSTESSGFRNIDLKLSHPLGKTGANMSLTYVIGGEDRNGVDQKNALVLGLSTGF